MNAEIRLTSVQPGEASGMIVKLASPDAFTRAGIERTGALTDLRFSVDESAGVPVIRIASSRPVVEPFLNFLVEVDWPTGRMVREYTVLLDPPVFMAPNSSDGSSVSEQPTTQQRSDASLLTPVPIERSDASDGFEVELVGSDVEVGNEAGIGADGGEVISLENLGSDAAAEVEIIGESAVPITDEGSVVALTDLAVANTDAQAEFQANQNFEFEVEVVGTSDEVSDTFVSGDAGSSVVTLDSDISIETDIVGGGGEVTVQRGDTLGTIADAVAVEGVSSQQMMMALLNANKNAFINGNVNLVKAGAILRIPEGDELAQLTQAQAVAQMGEQNQLWREYRDNIRSTAGTRLAEAPTQEVSSEAVDNQELPEISADAQRILDEARLEANRKELSIIGDSEPTDSAASAIDDNLNASDVAQLGEINKKLTLAKEELASTRLESVDLVEQSDELQSTAENMESLVNIRQSEVARLEEALRTATSEAEAERLAAEEAARVAAEQAETAKVAQAEAERVATEEAEAERVAQAEAEELANAEATIENEQPIVDTDAEGEAAPAPNALSESGEPLENVQLIDQVEAENTAVEAPATGEPAPFYMELLQKYGKWIVAGIGGLCALLVGVLLLGKRRRKAADDMLDLEDDVEFLDNDDQATQLRSRTEPEAPADNNAAARDGAANTAEASAGKVAGSVAGVAATGAAAAAAAGGAAAALATSSSNAASNNDDTAAFGMQADVLDNTTGPDGLDPDDTISEVDVYLAYGLHGQAEELLSKAIDRDPTNHEYAMKLLQTQHAQGNADAFAEGAATYHESFGGDKAPNWDTVCNLGHDLQPNNALFSSSAVAVESIGKSDDGSQTLVADDFSTEEGSAIGSVSRDFGDASETALDVDESDLMDQSLDPAFAFDETDLEATGDFTQMASDIAAEELSTNPATPAVDDTALEFPDFNAADSIGEVADAGKDKLTDVSSSLTAGVGPKIVQVMYSKMP